jgi:predicted dehydrogenase
MPVLSLLNFGIVGACGRGSSFKHACDAIGKVRIHAVCDTNAEALPRAKERLGAGETYVDFNDMLASSELDAVIIGTPMPLHVPQSIAALQCGLHVLSEVPAAVSIEECCRLVTCCSSSSSTYMMAENHTYARPNVIVRSPIEAGLLATPYYAEGEYLRELKRLNVLTPWRRKWQTGVDGITYGTHSLGSILQWMKCDRVESVCCAGTGHHYHDPSGRQYENQDTCVMLCKMRSGGLAKIRVDMLSDRAHAMTNYLVQRTDGCYESARRPGSEDRIWLRSRSPDIKTWMPFEPLDAEFLPESWKREWETASKAGHGGGDYFEVLDLVDAIEGERRCPIGIHEAMDMTLPGLCSQQSILEESRWIDVPDSRQCQQEMNHDSGA